MAGQTILLLECSCQVTGYVKDIRCAQVAPVLLSVCVCLIFPLAKMINALGDNIRYSLFTYSLIHSYIRHSAFNIHWSQQRWCRQAGRPSLTHETSCFDKGALPQTHQQRDTILCHTHTHTYTYIHNNAVHRSLIALTAVEIAIVSAEISNIKHYNDAINTHINMIL